MCWQRRFSLFSQYEVAKSNNPAQEGRLKGQVIIAASEPVSSLSIPTDGIFGRQVDTICVEELEESSVNRVGKLVHLYDLLQVLIPM